MQGFTYYNNPFPVGQATAEILASLSATQKIAILDGFARRVRPGVLRHRLSLPTSVISHLYGAIASIEARARELMRSDSPPASAAILLVTIQDDFADDFTSGQVEAILTKMVKYSKYDGSGTWTYYKAEVIK